MDWAADATCRVGRLCVYDGQSREGSTVTAPDTTSSSFSAYPFSTTTAAASTVDPYRHDALRQASVEIALLQATQNTIGSRSDVEQLIRQYCNTAHIRFPIICVPRLTEALSTIYSKPQAGFLLLCLCISIVMERPPHQPHAQAHRMSMQSSAYVNIKTLIARLEATNHISLSYIQARVLVCWYEFGHGLFPAARISIAACSGAARVLGLVEDDFRDCSSISDYATRLRAEERKRTLWAITNLDRYACSVHFLAGIDWIIDTFASVLGKHSS